MEQTIKVLDFKTEFKGTGKDTRSVDWVKFTPIGAFNTTATWVRIKEVMPPEEGFDRDDNSERIMYMRAKWDQIRPAYEAWKSGNEIPEDGTPLVAWPGINNDIAQQFIRHGIKTVEEVAGLNDANMSRVSLPNLRSLRNQAEAFLNAVESGAVAKQVTEQKEQVDALEEQLRETNEKLAAAMDLLQEQTKDQAKQKKPVKEAA